MVPAARLKTVALTIMRHPWCKSFYLIWALGIVLPSISFGEIVSTSTSTINAHEEWGRGYNDIYAALVALKPNIAEILARTQEIDKLTSGLKKTNSIDEWSREYDAKVQPFEDRLIRKYPGTTYISQIPFKTLSINKKHPVDEKTVLRINLQRAISAWQRYSPQNCVIKSSDSMSYLEAGQCDLPKMCANRGYSSNARAGMQLFGLNSDMTVNEYPVQSFEDELAIPGHIVSTGTATLFEWSKTIFYGCSALASTGLSINAASFAYAPSYEKYPKWSNPYVFAYDVETFRKGCIEDMLTEAEQSKFQNLIDTYHNAYPLSFWNQNFQKRKTSCYNAASNICRNTFSIKGTEILSYVTVQCKKRDVTANDVMNDEQYMSTEADRVAHSTLRDQILLCADAEKAGYHWLYQPPSLKGCKPEK